MFHHHHDESSDFLPSLTRSFTSLDVQQPISTREFVEACAKVTPIFDHIGTVFVFAKHEFETKRNTVAAQAEEKPVLNDIVEAGKADKTITVKNSPGRNLHRLLNTLAFISAIFKGLNNGKSLKDAVSTAYDETLGLLHAWVVRTGIKAGMLGLPTREHFFKSIGETEESAKKHGDGFIEAADRIVEAIETLYTGVQMPKSDFTMKSLWG